jgi:hypothetical protein
MNNMEKQTKLEIKTPITRYNVEIDFDDATNEWNKNKQKLENGCYKYICGYLCKSGKKCKKKPSLSFSYCSTHLPNSHT